MKPFSLRAYSYERPRRNRWPSRFFTLAAAVIVLFVHAVWLYVAANVYPAPDKSSQKPVRVFSYTPSQLRAPASDIQLMKSPVLMSLPTRVGFSGPLLGHARLDRIPAFEETPREFLESSEAFDVDPYGKSTRDLEAMVRDQRLKHVPGYADIQTRTNAFQTRIESAITMYWLDESGMTSQPLSDASATWASGDTAWNATVYVCLNDMDRASRVLLEDPAPDDLINQELLKTIRGMAFDFRPPGSCGRLMIRYMPLNRVVEKDI